MRSESGSSVTSRTRPTLPRIEGRLRVLLPAVGALVVLLIPLVLDQYWIHILAMVLFFGYLGVAWNILSGFSGQMSIGHSVFLGLGAYASTLLYMRLGVNPWIAMVIAAVGTAIVGVAIGFCLFRLRDAFFPLATMAFLVVVKLFATYFRGLTKGMLGLSLPVHDSLLFLTMSNKLGYYYIAFCLLCLGTFIAHKIRHSRLGLSLLALRDDHDAAESLGVATHLSKVMAMGISAFLVSVAGTFYAHYMLYIDPEQVFNVGYSFQMPLVSILGGIGTPAGPIIGAIIMVPVDAFLRARLSGQLAGLNLIVYGLILMVAVRFFPNGVLSIFRMKKGAGQGTKDSSQPSAPMISASLSEQAPPSGSAASPTVDQDILDVKDLTVQFGGLTAVKNFSLRVGTGEIVGLIGSNGAGKTTCFNAITGFITASRSSGTVSFLGRSIKPSTPPHVLSRTGMTRTFQIVKPFGRMTILENVMVATMMYGKNYQEARQKALAILEQSGLLALADIYPGSLTIAGQKRLELARALAAKPKLLMLDEPMAGLNPSEVSEMVAFIKQIAASGITVVIVEHIMKAIMSLCNRIVVLDHGEKIAEGTPTEVANNERVITAYLGVRYDA